MSASSKNLGQIAGVHIGTTPPTNTLLIWYDNTPSQLIHKVYNPSTKLWGALDPEIVTNITYSELTTLAKNTGLTIGKYFQLTDASNVLAIAITTTKVQYTDSKGNILIDDLGSNIQYHVSSSNLQIDDLSGVFDETNKKLVFQFDEYVPVISTDYLFGKVKRGTTWILAKFKFNSLLSTVTNNSLSWNSGLFFSFSAAIKNVLNKKGGVVGYDEYTTNNTKLNTSIDNVGKNNENIIANVDKALTEATTPSEIYAKAIPSAPATGYAPGDVLKGDTLLLIINKFQRWINSFKYATGIKLSSSFTTKTNGKVNNNDTVESAISKLQNQNNNIDLSLPENWEPYSNPNVNLAAGDDYNLALSKIEADRRKYNSIEMPKQDVGIQNSFGDDYIVKYRIHNGCLDIYFQEINIILQWFYTRMVANDEHVFFSIKFSDQLVSNLSAFLDNPMASSGYVILYDLATVSPFQIKKAVGWTSPDSLILARLSFGYTFNTQVNKVVFGIILTPISSMKVTLENNVLNTSIIGNDNNLTFQSILGVEGGFKFYVPKMLLKYKFI